MTLLKPVPATSAGCSFELCGQALGMYGEGAAGTVTETQHELVDAASNRAFARIAGSSFAVGQGGWAVPRVPHPVKAVNEAQVSQLPPVAGPRAHALQTRPGQVLLYRLNGDYNPLHALSLPSSSAPRSSSLTAGP